MSSDEQQIRDLVATWMSATKAGDIDTVLSLMTDDVVFLVAGQRLSAKSISPRPCSPPAGGTPLPTDRRPQRNPGNSGLRQLSPTCGAGSPSKSRCPAAKPTKRAGHTLSVLRKTDGRWQLARDANLLTPIKI